MDVTVVLGADFRGIGPLVHGAGTVREQEDMGEGQE